MPDKGYFIITDISGYTEYLTKSELEHVHATLQGLFDAQLAHIKFPSPSRTTWRMAVLRLEVVHAKRICRHRK